MQRFRDVTLRSLGIPWTMWLDTLEVSEKALAKQIFEKKTYTFPPFDLGKPICCQSFILKFSTPMPRDSTKQPGNRMLHTPTVTDFPHDFKSFAMQDPSKMNILTWPMAKLETFGDSIFSREK